MKEAKEKEKKGKSEKGKRGVRKKTTFSFLFFFYFFSSFPFILRLNRSFHPISLLKRQEREVEKSREKRKGREKEKKSREQLMLVFFTHCHSLFVLFFSLFSSLSISTISHSLSSIEKTSVLTHVALERYIACSLVSTIAGLLFFFLKGIQ